jgi:hypothetical protein
LRDGQFSGFSNTASITTTESPITSAPLLTNVSVSGSNVTFTLVNTDNQLVTLFADFATATTSRATGVRPNESRTFTLSFGPSDGTIFARAKAALKENSAIVSEKFAEDEAPAAPSIGATGIVVQPGFNVVNWTYETTDPIVDGFIVERNPGVGDFAAFDIISPQLAPISRRFLDTTVSSGVQYTYRIRAFNRVGNTLSNTRTVTAASSVPATPSNLTLIGVLAGSPGEGFVSISWQRNSTDEDGFFVQRKLSTQGAGSYVTVGGTAKAQTNFGETITGPSNTNYDYRIIAHNEFGNSAPSNILTVNIA